MSGSRSNGRFGVPPPILALLICEALLALAFVLVRQLPDPPESLLTITHLGLEATLPAWFSSMQLALVGALLFVFFLSERDRGVPALGLLFAAFCFLFLSVDEGAQIHELVSGILHKRILGTDIRETALPQTGYWMFFLVPALLAALGFAWISTRQYLTGQPARWKLLVGCAVFVLGATVPEVVYNYLEPGSMEIVVEQVVEEIGEMLGITIVLWGVLELLAVHDVRLRFR